MGKHRDKLQIIANILTIAKEGARKTQIMYQANLSYKLLSHYLFEVLEAGMVNKSEYHYLLTEKGQDFLDKYSEYDEYCKELDTQMMLIENRKKILEKLISDTISDS